MNATLQKLRAAQIDAISLAPGFSPVFGGRTWCSRFSGLPRFGKPLKRFTSCHAENTRLKPGANERLLRSVFRVTVFVIFTLAFHASAASLSKPALLNLQFEQKLNAQVPLGLSFTNEAGDTVALRDCFRSRPVVLVLGYYECPMLCSLVLNGAVEAFQDMRSSAGKDFDVLFVSINPRETPALAAAKKRTYLKRYGRAGTEHGWHFLVGRESETKALSDAVGFQFAFDSTLKQYAHPSGIIVLTPEGRVAKYFFGVSYPAKELSAALKEASAKRVGSPVRQLLILCFQHMPLTGKNSANIMSAVRALAAVTLVAIVAWVTVAIRKERRRQAQAVAAQTESPAP